MIESLIDKQDSFEIVRDQLAFILASEVARQMQLATGAGQDPQLWRLRVFLERSNPWEEWLHTQDDRSPIVNIWFNNASYDGRAGNVVERQKTDAVFNIDCYGCGLSTDDDSGGHNPGDRDAALVVHRALRLVRNIVMAADYTYLGLRGLVWGRWPQSVTTYQPEINGRTVQHIVGARLALQVVFNEFSPQAAGQNLEIVSIDGLRQPNGQIIVEADYDYTV